MKRLLLLTTLVVFVSSCTKNTTIEDGSSRTISFETHVGKSSKSAPVTAFKDGDAVGVVAYQSATDWATDGAVGTPFMDNLPLRKAGTWALDVTRYWEKDKKYTFFGYAPYSSTVVVADGVLNGYTVPSKADDQQDFMVSIPTDDTKDMSYDGLTTPGTVKFAFAHAMSQVRFSAATDNDYSRLYAIEMKSITINGISNKGNINLATDALSANPWTNQEAAPADYSTSVTFATPVAFSDALTSLNGGNVFMPMPQSFTDAQIEFLIHVTNKNAGGPTATGDYPVTAKITGTWDRNKVYHYEATLDMEQILGVKPIVIGDPSITEWEAEENQDIHQPLIVTVPDAGAGSTATNILVSKPSAAGSSSEVSIESSVASLAWTASIEAPQVAYINPAKTRTEEVVTWLTIADDATGTNQQSQKSGTGNQKIFIYIAQENLMPTPRTAIVKIDRLGASITITVTQEKGTPTAPVTPPVMNAWAASNVYWDGTKLTFDVESPNSAVGQKQGVFFQWGSLVAIGVLNKGYTTEEVVYSPSGKTYNWSDIPQIAFDFPDSKSTSCLLPNHIPTADVGDVCKYISEKGWVVGNWRMPTGAEFDAVAASAIVAGNYLTSGSAVASKDGTGNRPWYVKHVYSSVTYRFPLSDIRNEDNGNYNGLVNDSYYNSASYASFYNGYYGCYTYTATRINASFVDGAVSRYPTRRATPIRCVRMK